MRRILAYYCMFAYFSHCFLVSDSAGIFESINNNEQMSRCWDFCTLENAGETKSDRETVREKQEKRKENATCNGDSRNINFLVYFFFSLFGAFAAAHKHGIMDMVYMNLSHRLFACVNGFEFELLQSHCRQQIQSESMWFISSPSSWFIDKGVENLLHINFQWKLKSTTCSVAILANLVQVSTEHPTTIIAASQ